MIPTNDQRAAITTAGNVRITVEGIECVLVRSDLFDHVQSVLGDDWTHDEMRAALARSSKENGWDEPAMEAYDDNGRETELTAFEAFGKNDLYGDTASDQTG